MYAYLERLPISLMYSTQFVSLCFTLGTEYLIYKIANLKFNYKVAVLSCAVFSILVGTNILHSNGGNAEIFFMFFAAFSVYIYILKENLYKYIYIAGFILGLGVLFKVNVLFDGFFIILYIFFTYKFREFFIRSFIYSLGVITPVIIFLLYELSISNLSNTIKYTFLNNFSYVSKFNKFYGISSIDINIFVFFIIVVGSFYLYKKEKIALWNGDDDSIVPLEKSKIILNNTCSKIFCHCIFYFSWKSSLSNIYNNSTYNFTRTFKISLICKNTLIMMHSI